MPRQAIVLVALCVGCSGQIGGEQPRETPRPGTTPDGPRPGPAIVTDPSVPAPPPASPGAPPPAPPIATPTAAAPVVRRLTRLEYDNTIRDLLGDTTRPAAGFIPETLVAGFENDATAMTVPPSLAEDYFDAAEAVAARAVTKLSTLVPCATKADAACAASFVAGFGKRAWRRPLTADETTRLMALFDQGAARRGFAGGVDLVLRALLFSPAFLFRVEQDPQQPGSWGMASRLSYFLYASMPDDALFAAAERDELRTPAQIAAQAERMLASPKAQDAIRSFHRQWLDLRSLDGIDKDAKLFPRWTATVAPLLRQEIEVFTMDVVTKGLDAGALFSGDRGFANAKLATFYGLTGPKTDAFEPVPRDPARSAGVLTLGGVLAAHAHRDQTSPSMRGKFVREQIFCSPLPPPPPSANNNAPPLDPTLSTRERFARHAEDPSCSPCHQLMDPLGLAFENYDAVGLWRDTDGGKPIDASGAIHGADVDGPFEGPAALGRKVASSARARTCLARQWFRFAMGRDVATRDLDALERAAANLAPGSGGFRKFLVAVTQTPAFLGGGAP